MLWYFMNTILIDGINFDLIALQKDIWNRLLNGALRYKDAFHNPAVANVNTDGVNMRTVVLRKVWPDKKQLAFHTDIRSGKWQELELQNNISWLFYDASARLQIRLAGTATLHYNDLIADEAWATSTMSSRKIYLGEEGPSVKSLLPVSGLPKAFETNDPLPEESIAGRKNFGVVVTKVNWIEWLWLNSKGHRRATFTYNAENDFSANWLIP
jgi:pyridoxamine 5'-phosphate oxidase